MNSWKLACLLIIPLCMAASAEELPNAEITTPLTAADLEYLDQQGWDEHVETAIGIWVSVDDQLFRIVENGRVIWAVPCSTAANGTGSQNGSEQTPLGWHVVSRKIGTDAPIGQVFRSRGPTKEIWKPGDDTKKDLVLTRILILDGLEPGKNKGGDVDSRDRYIYVHGTNDEANIGTPASHGCVRLRNEDIIAAFDLIPEDTPLLITEKKNPPE
jgi:hypothetical protein